MRTLSLMTKLVLFLLLLGFAVRNDGLVTVSYFFDVAWQAPLALVMFLAFAGGLLSGVIALLPALWRQRRKLSGLQRDLDAARVALSATETPRGINGT